MTKDSVLTNTFNIVKSDAELAAYQVVAEKAVDLVCSNLLSLAKKNGFDSALLEQVLSTAVGKGVVSVTVGLAGTYLPQVHNNEKLFKLCAAMRINGFKLATSELFDLILQPLLEVAKSKELDSLVE